MPVFLIQYTSPRQNNAIQHETEWICDRSYDADRAREAFEQQFPSAAVVCVQEID